MQIISTLFELSTGLCSWNGKECRRTTYLSDAAECNKALKNLSIKSALQI